MKPKLLDLFCKAGGAGMGYSRAGFEVMGIDKDPQPDYPFEFIQADAIEFGSKRGHEFHAIHASPPCQKFSKSTGPWRKQKNYPDLVEPTREMLIRAGKPYVMENVIAAPIRRDLTLDGTMFGLRVIRKRKFELGNGFFMMQPFAPKQIGSVRAGDYCCVYGKGSYRKSLKDAYPKFKKSSVRETWGYAMGIDWMKKDTDLAEAIPPAYTEYIGGYLLEFLKKKNSISE